MVRKTAKNAELVFTLTHELKKEMLRRLGGRLKLAQFGILKLIAEADQTRLKDLAAGAGIAQPTLSPMIDSLVGCGLVLRETDPTDRRAVRVRLSAKGEKIYRRMLSEREVYVESLIAKLSEKDRKEILRILGLLVQELKK